MVLWLKFQNRFKSIVYQWNYHFRCRGNLLGIAIAKALPSGGNFYLPRNDTKIAMSDRILSTNPVLARRLAKEWSQAELAERASISRAAVSAIEGERI